MLCLHGSVLQSVCALSTGGAQTKGGLLPSVVQLRGGRANAFPLSGTWLLLLPACLMQGEKTGMAVLYYKNGCSARGGVR